VANIVRILRATQGEHRGRTRISHSYLEHLAGIRPGQLWRFLQLRTVREVMQRRGWTFTTSQALGLPALEAFPFSVPFLVRN
jgi:hypothetical protein